ncbi:MAG TPA: protein phosphatase 2C domain-containing protein [Gemmatimonadaceae bacterium]|nr:protein phosphatase 2C domain-containing protein [Gemmatimonadaceae bacterium]
MTSSLSPLSPSGSAMIRVDVCGRTDVGRTREHNEDSFLLGDVSGGAQLPEHAVVTIGDGSRRLLFMVADGMGGAAAGEIASDMAVGTVFERVTARWAVNGSGPAPDGDATAFALTLREAAEEANRRIHLHATEHPEYRGMGTTATIAGLFEDTIYIAQVGDSRAYLIRGGRALQITKDQSLLQRLVEAGEMTEEEAERSERRNIILQALGPEARVVIDLTHQQLRRDDLLILCSDGLSSLVRGEEIARIAAACKDVCELCERLIDAANACGGPDNITVIAARFTGDGLAPATESDEVGHRRFPDAAPPPDDDWINRDPILPPPPLTVEAAPPPPPAELLDPPVALPASPPPVPAQRRARGELWVRVLGALLVLTAAGAAAWWLWRWLGR